MFTETPFWRQSSGSKHSLGQMQMNCQMPESSMWSHLYTSSPDMTTPQGRAAPSQQYHPKQPRSCWEHFLCKVRCSRNSALYPKPPDSDVLPRSGTEMVLFSAQPNKLSYWKGWEQACFKRFGKVRAEEQLIRLSGLYNGFL